MSPEPSGCLLLGAVVLLDDYNSAGLRAMAQRSGAGFESFGVSQIVRGAAWGFTRVCCSPRQPWARLGLPADLLALRTRQHYVKPSPANCLSTETVRVRRLAKVDIKAFVRTGRLSYNQAASSAICCWGGGVDCVVCKS